MKEEAAAIRPSAPYRRTLDSPLARRLCTDAWSDRADASIPEATEDALRAACLRALLAVASEDDMDVLTRFRATAYATAAAFVVDTERNGPTTLRRIPLGCSILLPAFLVKDGVVRVRSAGDPASDSDAVRADVPDGVEEAYLARIAARAGVEREQDAITRVNRAVGRITWRQLLDLVPETREHVMALQADVPHHAHAHTRIAA